MNKKIRWITETAVMLALLVALQAITGSMGQIVTGSCVNAVLAVCVLTIGLSSGLVVALISPVLAYLLGIAPMLVTVPGIMAGNCAFVLLLHFLADRNNKKIVKQVIAWIVSAVGKFAVLYLVVVKLILGVMAESLLASGTLKPPMIAALTAKFSWPQLITALIGGAAALLITPVIRKALKK